MFTLEQKVWTVQKCFSEPSHTVVRQMFMKKFGIKGRRTKLFAEKYFSELHNHFLKFGTITDHRSKKVSPVKRNLKEAVKSPLTQIMAFLSEK